MFSFFCSEGFDLFIKKSKAKGNLYFYLCSYDSNSPCNVKLTYKFGRKEIALNTMKAWKGNVKDFPKELIDMGCKPEDVDQWLHKIEQAI